MGILHFVLVCCGLQSVGFVQSSPLHDNAAEFPDTIECLAHETAVLHGLDFQEQEEEEFEIRLVDGAGEGEGRLEVKYVGVWGTVCQNGFTNREATIVCRTLGYSGPGEAVMQAHYGQGYGQIWLDEMKCSWLAASFRRCQHKAFGHHDCFHGMDVGVKCYDLDLSSIPVCQAGTGSAIEEGLHKVDGEWCQCMLYPPGDGAPWQPSTPSNHINQFSDDSVRLDECQRQLTECQQECEYGGNRMNMEVARQNNLAEQERLQKVAHDLATREQAISENEARINARENRKLEEEARREEKMWEEEELLNDREAEFERVETEKRLSEIQGDEREKPEGSEKDPDEENRILDHDKQGNVERIQEEQEEDRRREEGVREDEERMHQMELRREEEIERKEEEQWEEDEKLRQQEEIRRRVDNEIREEAMHADDNGEVDDSDHHIEEDTRRYEETQRQILEDERRAEEERQQMLEGNQNEEGVEELGRQEVEEQQHILLEEEMRKEDEEKRREEEIQRQEEENRRRQIEEEEEQFKQQQEEEWEEKEHQHIMEDDMTRQEAEQLKREEEQERRDMEERRRLEDDALQQRKELQTEEEQSEQESRQSTGSDVEHREGDAEHTNSDEVHRQTENSEELTDSEEEAQRLAEQTRREAEQLQREEEEDRRRREEQQRQEDEGQANHQGRGHHV